MKDMKELKALIKLIIETDISEFKLENQEEKIHIKRGPEKEFVQMAASAPMPQASAPAAAAPPPSTPVAGDQADVTSDDQYEVIPSPIVGTFYRKPSPDAAPFTTVGDIIEAGQVLCLVEAMKLFNEIEAEFKCRIIEICKDDAAPVEYGEPLFRVERV